MNLTSLWLLRL